MNHDCTPEMDALLEIYKTQMTGAKQNVDESLPGVIYYMRQMVEMYDEYLSARENYRSLKHKLGVEDDGE